MRYKTLRIEKEFAELDLQNPRLKEALLKLEQLCDEMGLDEPVITCIYRGPDENCKAEGISKSPHLIWEGADIRSTIYKPDEQQDLLKAVNMLYKYGNKPALMFHKTPSGVPHGHLQIKKEEESV